MTGRGEDKGPLGFGEHEDTPEGAPRAEDHDPDHAPEPDAQAHRPVGVPRPSGASRYGWFAGLVIVLLLGYVTLNTVRTGSDAPGARGLEQGSRLPAFAVPLALSDLDGDANVATRANLGDAGPRPACEVRGPKVLNSCALAEGGPVVLAFLVTRGGDCTPTLDLLERARSRHPGVGFAAVDVRGDRGELRDLIRAHGWGFPVGYDRDGVLANLFGVAVCPQITYASWRGRIQGTSFGDLTVAELDRRIARIVRVSRAAGWRPAR